MTTAIKQPAARKTIVFMAILVNAIVVKNGFIDTNKWYWALLVTVPLLVFILKMTKYWEANKHHSLLNDKPCKQITA